MTVQECARFWGFGVVLGFCMRWVLGLMHAIFRGPAASLGEL